MRPLGAKGAAVGEKPAAPLMATNDLLQQDQPSRNRTSTSFKNFGAMVSK